jgi:fructuronate reductase
MVHLGIGAFHRAHLAVCTEDAARAAGETRWGIFGVTGRSDAVVRQLAPQDCLYGVLFKGRDSVRLRLVASVRDVAWPGDRTGDVLEALASPAVHLATLTLTEKGYSRGADGGIDLDSADVQHDLALLAHELVRDPQRAGESAGGGAEEACRTPMGLLVRGLARRFRAGGAPFTVVSCDNLASNGRVTRSLVYALVDALPGHEGLVHWLQESVTFPSTMVDRIAPATTARDRDKAFSLLGLTDSALVVAEPFQQWIIEDNFASDRPRWELAGAILTDDVAPFEAAKLRILNATHSFLAWLGGLMEYVTIAEAIADPTLRALSLKLINEDVLPTLTPLAQLSLAEYRDSVIDRFSNPNLAHTTAQVGADGSQKLPNRVVGTVSDRLRAGAIPRHLALLVAAWIANVARAGDPGGRPLDDPMAPQLTAAVPSTAALNADRGGSVRAILGMSSIFPAEVGHAEAFVDEVISQLDVVAGLVQHHQELP